MDCTCASAVFADDQPAVTKKASKAQKRLSSSPLEKLRRREALLKEAWQLSTTGNEHDKVNDSNSNELHSTAQVLGVCGTSSCSAGWLVLSITKHMSNMQVMQSTWFLLSALVSHCSCVAILFVT